MITNVIGALVVLLLLSIIGPVALVKPRIVLLAMVRWTDFVRSRGALKAPAHVAEQIQLVKYDWSEYKRRYRYNVIMIRLWGLTGVFIAVIVLLMFLAPVLLPPPH